MSEPPKPDSPAAVPISPENVPRKRSGVYRFKTHEEADAWMEKYGPRARDLEAEAAALGTSMEELRRQFGPKVS